MSYLPLFFILAVLHGVGRVMAAPLDLEAEAGYIRRGLQGPAPTPRPTPRPSAQPTPVTTAFPSARAATPATRGPTGCQPGAGQNCGDMTTRNGYIIFRCQQILTSSDPPPPADSENQWLTKDFVYANKYLFKDLIKQADLSWWNKYSLRNSKDPVTKKTLPNWVDWLSYDSLKKNTNFVWGTQAGWRSAKQFQEHATMEIESVRDLAPGESEQLFASRSSSDFFALEREQGQETLADEVSERSLGGCRKLLKPGSSVEEELLGGAGCPPPPPPPPSIFRPEVLITYYYVFVPSDLGFSSMNAARDSFNNAVNNWPLVPKTLPAGAPWVPFTADNGYRNNFSVKRRDGMTSVEIGDIPIGTPFSSTELKYVPGLTTERLWVSTPVVSNGVPTLAPTESSLVTSGLNNSTSMPAGGYAGCIIVVLIGAAAVWYFCHKKSKAVETRGDILFTGKIADHHELGPRVKYQERELQRMEQQFAQHHVNTGPPPPPGPVHGHGGTPPAGRKSIDMGHGGSGGHQPERKLSSSSASVAGSVTGSVAGHH